MTPNNNRIAICPGSYDPITNGHIDIIERAAGLFGSVVVGILVNPAKSSLFTVEERTRQIERLFARRKNVTVDSFDGLLVGWAKSVGARVIVRGIRAVSDYEYELQMALMNRRLEPAIDTHFLLPREEFSFLSSRLVKEVCSLGGDVSGLVPPLVEKELRKKLG